MAFKIESIIGNKAEDLLGTIVDSIIEAHPYQALDAIIEQEGAADVAQYIHDKFNLFEIMDTLEDETMQMLKDKAGEPGSNKLRSY